MSCKHLTAMKSLLLLLGNNYIIVSYFALHFSSMQCVLFKRKGIFYSKKYPENKISQIPQKLKQHICFQNW